MPHSASWRFRTGARRLPWVPSPRFALGLSAGPHPPRTHPLQRRAERNRLCYTDTCGQSRLLQSAILKKTGSDPNQAAHQGFNSASSQPRMNPGVKGVTPRLPHQAGTPEHDARQGTPSTGRKGHQLFRPWGRTSPVSAPSPALHREPHPQSSRPLFRHRWHCRSGAPKRVRQR